MPGGAGAAVVRFVQKVSSTPGFAKVAPHVVPVVDRAVHRLSRGRVMLSAVILPSVVITAKGAKSGLPRRTALAAVPEKEAGTWLLVGSNFGRPPHPVWTANLLKHPEAEISWKGRDIPVTARLLEGEERARAWEAVVRYWPPYEAYQARVERRIRLFRVERR